MSLHPLEKLTEWKSCNSCISKVEQQSYTQMPRVVNSFVGMIHLMLSLLPLLHVHTHRKWGLAQNDMNTLFRPLSRLCDLLMNFFSEVRHWLHVDDFRDL